MIDRRVLSDEGLLLAESVAGQMFARFGRRVALHDLRALARPAALEAAQRWDGRGVFAKYALQRIRWTVLDELRRKREKPIAGHGEAARQAAAEVLEKVADGLWTEDPQLAADRTEALRALVGRSAAALTLELDAANTLPDHQR